VSVSALLRWAPASLMGLAALFTVGIDLQRAMPLRQPLAVTVPSEIAGYIGRDIELSEAELTLAGATNHLMRVYTAPGGVVDGGDWFTVYVGYYAQQRQGKTIHSPKNCLPGSGWEPLASRAASISVGDRKVTVNRYILQRGDERGLVLYWYQGRGRVEASEYRVKWDLLRDAAVRQRTEEALVRVVVPVMTDEDDAFDIASQAAGALVLAVGTALPH
jgi:EpsI family protein